MGSWWWMPDSASCPNFVDHWDYRIWLEVSAGTMVARAVVRDVWMLGGEGEIRERYERHWVPTDALYAEMHRPERAAHCVIDSTDFAKPVILRI
jgi:hypothetical protein